MNRLITSGISTALLSGLLLTTGCSSSDGSSSTGTSGVATVPANAIVLDATNAEPTVATSVTSTDALSTVLAAGATPAIGLKDALELIKPRIESVKNTIKNSGIDPVFGVAVSDSGNCLVSGSFSFTGDNSGTAPNFTDSGTVTATNCDDGDGAVLNGRFSWVQSWNNVTGSYSDTLTGSFSIQFNGGGLSGTFSFSGLDYAETGNDLIPGSETYNVSKATFAVDLPGGNGFLVNLSAPIIESVGGYNHCPESGGIRITGANGTTAEGIYNGDGTMTIKANGVVIDAAATCYN